MTSIYHIKIPKSNMNVWAKMENENPTGTHKDRSLGPWIEHYINEPNKKRFVISSSGNSAVAAAKICEKRGAKLHIFMRQDYPGSTGETDVESPRLRELSKYKCITVTFTSTPKKEAFQFAKKYDIPYLRASTDDFALDGYREIALELAEQLPEMDNIFIPTSSGATLVGMHNGFKRGGHKKIPALYVVQTAKVHPIASCFDKDFKKENESHATAIVDNIAHRKDRVIEIIERTKSGGFVISNKQLEQAAEILKTSNFINPTGSDPVGLKDFGWRSQAPDGAWQSALAFAGFLKWRKKNPDEADKQVSVCLFTD